MAIHSPKLLNCSTIKAVNIAVLVTMARLVPSDVVVKSFSGLSKSVNIACAPELPSSASFFILIRLTDTIPISEPEKNASIIMASNTQKIVVVGSIMLFQC